MERSKPRTHARTNSLLGRAIRWGVVLATALLVGGAVAQATFTVGLSLSTLNNPFFVDVRDGAQQEAQLLGINLVVTDAQNDLNKQISDIEDLIQQKVNVLLVNATDSAGIVPAVKQANDAGIPVFAIDRAIDVSTGAEVVAQIASDNVYGGKLQAQRLAQVLGGSGNVVELEGIPGASAAIDRKTGFETELKSVAPNITIIADQPAGFDQAEGLSVMQNILQAHQGQIDAVVAANDSMAVGALQAIQQASATRPNGQPIVVIGFDAIDQALQQIGSGAMDSTIAQQPKLMGRLGVDAAHMLSLDSLIFSTLESGQFMPVEVQLITKDNLPQ
ncbi:MAG: substrate-binding domain-containing protein [Deinococcales bacterium]